MTIHFNLCLTAMSDFSSRWNSFSMATHLAQRLIKPMPQLAPLEQERPNSSIMFSGAALERGLLPIYILAEDLFAEVIRTEEVYTQGDVAQLVARKIEQVCQLISASATDQHCRETLRNAVDPRGTNQVIWDALIAKYPRTDNLKVVLLVDELEGQYKTLQERVQSPGDRTHYANSLGVLF